jgi:hypothetical protein
MVAAVTISGRDLRILAGIVSVDRGDLPVEGLAPSMLSDLSGLISCDWLSFAGQDSRRQALWFGQCLPVEAAEGADYDDSPFWQHYWASLPAATLSAPATCAA